MELSLIDKVPATFPLTVKDSSGNTVTPATVGVAFLPFRASPDTSTTWTPATYASGAVAVVLAGPLADPTGAVAVPAGGGELWALVTESSGDVVAVRVGFVSAPALPASAAAPAQPAILDAMVAALIGNRATQTYAAVISAPSYPNGA